MCIDGIDGQKEQMFILHLTSTKKCDIIGARSRGRKYDVVLFSCCAAARHIKKIKKRTIVLLEVIGTICRVCDGDIGHRDGCCLDGGDIREIGEIEELNDTDELVCSMCGQTIASGEEYIYDVRYGCEAVCGECIEHLEMLDVLEICGVQSVTELIAITTDKICRAGETY